MRKNKLIELLSKIPGNPEVTIWNGFVSDYQDIYPEIVEITPVKVSFDYYKQCIVNEKKRHNQSFVLDEATLQQIHQTYQNQKYELNDFVTPEDIANKHYTTKKMFILQGKVKGETYWDRVGKMHY